MKKIWPFLFILFAAVFIISCDNDDDIDEDTISAVYDLRNQNFAYNSTDGWNISRTFNSSLFDSDIVLIYRQTGTTNDGSPVWQPIPRTLYLTVNNTAQELDYDFDFSKYDFIIYAGGTYDLNLTPEYINNQTFRVVLVPASFGRNVNLGNLNKMSYDEVIKTFNIDDTKVGTL